MHPNDLFKEVKFKKDDFDIGYSFDSDIREKLSNVHPLNFIKTTVELPIYEVVISYETKNVKFKTVKKYMILNTSETDGQDSLDYYAKVFAESEINKYNRRNKNREMKNYSIDEVNFITMAVLPIG